METNVQQIGQSTNIPAGIFSGTEIFIREGQLYAIQNGMCLEFEDLPSVEKRSFMAQYIADKEGQQFIKKQFGITGFAEGFKKWMFCKFGSLDGSPDSVDNTITPDVYNNACTSTTCPGRGKFCSCESTLKGYEVETLRELKSGKTVKEVADVLCVSVPAVKSRIERLKEKFNVANVVALVAMTTELGI